VAASLVGDPRPRMVTGPIARDYLLALIPPDDPECGPLLTCLEAVERRDLPGLVGALHATALWYSTQYIMHSARALAHVSYRGALEIGSWQDAFNAACLLNRIAVLDENPVAAERWAMRAAVHQVRVQSATPRV
jgi:hypothetical protein